MRSTGVRSHLSGRDAPETQTRAQKQKAAATKVAVQSARRPASSCGRSLRNRHRLDRFPRTDNLGYPGPNAVRQCVSWLRPSIARAEPWSRRRCAAGGSAAEPPFAETETVSRRYHSGSDQLEVLSWYKSVLQALRLRRCLPAAAMPTAPANAAPIQNAPGIAEHQSGVEHGSVPPLQSARITRPRRYLRAAALLWRRPVLLRRRYRLRLCAPYPYYRRGYYGPRPFVGIGPFGSACGNAARRVTT